MAGILFGGIMRNVSIIGVFAIVLGLVLAAGPAEAVRTWPRGKITYVDLTKDKPAVRRAVKAWNTSGIDIRFVKVRSKRKAQLLIRNSTRVPGGCGTGLATVGYTPGRKAFVNILHGSAARGQGCAWPGQTLVTTHELGHVIGLGHTDNGCSLMNTSHTNGVAPTNCVGSSPSGAKPGTWRCGLFARKDLRKAKRLYGGKVKVPSPTWCETTPRITDTGPLDFSVDGSGYPTLTITRAAEPTLPAWLVPWGYGEPGIEVHATPVTCTASPGHDAPTSLGWSSWGGVPVGGTKDITGVLYLLEPGAQCVRVWQFDRGSNYARVASEFTVNVPSGRFAPNGSPATDLLTLPDAGALTQSAM